MLIKRKVPKSTQVDVFLYHREVGNARPAILTHVRLPLEQVRAHWGVRGYYVRYVIPWPLILSIMAGLLFATQTGVLVWLMTHRLADVYWPSTIGLVMGLVFGYGMGRMAETLDRGRMPEHMYLAWAEWNQDSGNSFVPMEYARSAEVTMNTEEKQAYLAAIGRLPPARTKKAEDKGGAEPSGEDDGLYDVVPVYTSGGFFEQLQATIARRILSGGAKGERFAQMASIGGIAVAMLIIAALVGITVTDQRSQRAGSSVAAVEATPGPNQDASNRRR